MLPALLLNYFGQGAHLLLSNLEAVENPFFHLAPDWGHHALGGAGHCGNGDCLAGGDFLFSLTRQAIQQGCCRACPFNTPPTMKSARFYIPAVNWALLGSVIIVVLAFQNSSALAAAYGIAVTGTMIITSILACTVARRQWAGRCPCHRGAVERAAGD